MNNEKPSGAGIDLASLASPETTTLELKHPVSDKPVGIKLTGFTPDSAQWAKNQEDIYGVEKSKALMRFEKGGASMEVDNDPEKRKELVFRSLTKLEGAKDFDGDSATEIKKLLSKPEYKWMLEQWEDHIDERKGFFAKGK